MLKKMVILSLVILVLLSSGCDRKSVNDVYSIVDGGNSAEGVGNSKSLSALEAYERGVTEGTKHVYNDPGYVTWSLDDFPELVEQGDVCTTVIRGNWNTTLSFCVKDSVITDNFNNIRELTSEEAYLNLRNFLLNTDKNNLIDEQGNINDSIRGVQKKVVFIKINIKNENDTNVNFYPMNLKLYSVDEKNNQIKYRLVENNDKICVDRPDDWTLKGSTCITLQPGESKEVIIGYFIESVWLEQYKGNYEDKILGDEVPLDNIYLTTHFIDTGKSVYYKQGFESNKSLLKLDLRKI